MPFGPRLQGRQVVLRPPVAADEDARQRLGRHEEIQRMYGLVNLVLGHAFGRLGLDEVHLDVLAFNERAIRCYRHAGFRVDGTKPSGVVIDDEEIDDVVMSITALEFARRARS